MDPIGNNASNNMQASSAQPIEAPQSSPVIHPSGHANTLTSAMLSNHALATLSIKEAQGDKTEKTLASFAKWAIVSGQLQISSDQQPNDNAQFRVERNQDVLLIQAKLNERSEYDVLNVELSRGSEAPVSMTLTQPRAAVSEAARPPPTLSNLPNELLLQIASNTGVRGKGVNLSMRGVNQQMRAIAERQMSPRRRFLVENGQSLSKAGYSRHAMHVLSGLTPAQQHFALTHGPALHATAGYDGYDINDLVRLPPTQQHFAVTHGPTLRATVGYHAQDINFLSHLTPAQQHFAMTYGPTLRATAGYDPQDINDLADSTPAQQHFAVTNGPTLFATAGYNGDTINELTFLTPAQQHLALTNGPRLAAAGYSGGVINVYAVTQMLPD